ncbi:MAG: GNAT family N-acetyltransferase [Salinigranum sp.]
MTADGVRIAHTPETRADAMAVREAVFVDEQGIPPGLERDGRESESIHFVAYESGRPVGAARLRPLDGDVGKVERVAVVPAVRGEGWGRRLMDAVESAARRRGMGRLTLHAQASVVGFYDRLGYERVGDVFAEAGIEHVEMVASLDP